MSEFDVTTHDFTNRFKAAYYAPDKTIHQLPLGECARSIANEFSRDYPHLLQQTIARVALDSLLEAPSPDTSANYDPLKGPALEIMAVAMQYDVPVTIWTVGDTGEYHDPARDVHDPAYDYQLVKINQSGLRDRVAAMLGGYQITLAVRTSAASKESALHDILIAAEKSDVQDVFVADDLYKNEQIVQSIASDYPALRVHFWLVKDDEDSQGNIAAYRDCVLPKLRQNAELNRKSILVLDLDETIFDTQASLVRAAKLTREKLAI